MATSPLLVLSRGNSSTCCDRALDRCLLNEAELVQDLSALHAAIVASVCLQAFLTALPCVCVR
eukprot:926436-Rhodomonas_salina.4